MHFLGDEQTEVMQIQEASEWLQQNNNNNSNSNREVTDTNTTTPSDPQTPAQTTASIQQTLDTTTTMTTATTGADHETVTTSKQDKTTSQTTPMQEFSHDVIELDQSTEVSTSQQDEQPATTESGSFTSLEVRTSEHKPENRIPEDSTTDAVTKSSTASTSTPTTTNTVEEEEITEEPEVELDPQPAGTLYLQVSASLNIFSKNYHLSILLFFRVQAPS